MTTLHAKGLSKSFRGRRVVDDVSFSVSPGEVVGLLGPNGAGKTTSFHCGVGLLVPDSGAVRLGDRDLSGLPLHERARMGIGYLPQADRAPELPPRARGFQSFPCGAGSESRRAAHRIRPAARRRGAGRDALR